MSAGCVRTAASASWRSKSKIDRAIPLSRRFLNAILPNGELSHALISPFDCPSPFIDDTGYHSVGTFAVRQKR